MQFLLTTSTIILRKRERRTRLIKSVTLLRLFDLQVTNTSLRLYADDTTE